MPNESELGKEDHPPDVKRKLIRLAYFKRFPKLVKSNLTKFLQLVDSTLTDEAVCAALDMPVKATDTQDDTQVLAEKTKGIKWDKPPQLGNILVSLAIQGAVYEVFEMGEN
ncbi:hypothetical protein PCASD_07315 [Puccinia coronata f. sp. avenae]|uniref:Uncharacterized protein n=1 Tax=Puccinia coronata f. sp. avenae TaxID=200324 RepID=A0A2N5SL10_9BASI|nr:hypothetical protein PCASD_19937 [Puccinia coronata f. sp. avenae]PLW40376.1 hypothetical protein PCASD_07315 [Puccinia coronata f. sp. avenae]